MVWCGVPKSTTIPVPTKPVTSNPQVFLYPVPMTIPDEGKPAWRCIVCHNGWKVSYDKTCPLHRHSIVNYYESLVSILPYIHAQWIISTNKICMHSGMWSIAFVWFDFGSFIYFPLLYWTWPDGRGCTCAMVSGALFCPSFTHGWGDASGTNNCGFID